jgi:hypothetical protein
MFGPNGVNAVVFLMHKAIGRGRSEDTPTVEQTRPLIIKAFSSETTAAFDVCSMPHIAAAERSGAVQVNWDLLDFCDGARFTVYIDENLNVAPCSFIRESRFAESLRERPMGQIWNGEKFGEFRRLLHESPFACPALTSQHGPLTED